MRSQSRLGRCRSRGFSAASPGDRGESWAGGGGGGSAAGGQFPGGRGGAGGAAFLRISVTIPDNSEIHSEELTRA
jgi:hypothetical protein